MTIEEDRSAPRRLVLGVIAAGIVARLVLAGLSGLGVDESYAAAVARPFSLSYFDHPPMVFWLVGATEALVGQHAWALRLPLILLFAGTTWLLFRLGSRLYGEWAGAYGAVALNLAPFFSLSAGSWIVPDGPLLFFLVAGAYCLSRALDDPGDRLTWWIAAGVAGGCAGLSKYVAVFTAAGAFGFLATSNARRWLTRPGPWIATGVALLVASPVVIWNASHGWASFRFQGAHTGVSSVAGFHPEALLTSVAGQALYLLPWIWLALLWVLVAGFRAGPATKDWLLSWLAVGPILTLALLALGGHPGLPHWAAGGYEFLFPLLGAWIARQRVRFRRVELIGSAAVLFLLLAVFGAQAATGAVSEAFPAAFRVDPTLELVDWSPVRPLFERLGIGSARAFAAAPDWIAAGKLGYALGPSVPVLCLGPAPHHFAYRFDAAAFQGKDALLIERADQNARGLFAQAFHDVDSVATLTIYRGARPAFALTVFVGRGFTPNTVSPEAGSPRPSPDPLP